MKRLIVILMLIAMVLNISACRSTAKDTPESQLYLESDEEPLRCSAVIEDDFREYEVMVCIKKEFSKLKPDYTASDFPYLKLRTVTEAMEYKEGYRAVLYLSLKTPGKQNVLDAVKLLEKDRRVYYAGPIDFAHYKEPAILCHAGMDSDFKEDKVVVEIKMGYNRGERKYTLEDFPYLELERVEYAPTYYLSERVALNLYLKTPGKQNVLDAISRLEKDERVYHACPDYLLRDN